VKTGFRDTECLAYFHYPLFSHQGEDRDEPDIIVANPALGLIVIEVRACEIDDLSNISSDWWRLKDGRSEVRNPYAEAKSKLKSLVPFCEGEQLFHVLGGHAFGALPNITAAQWRDQGFGDVVDTSTLLFDGDLVQQTLLRRIKDAEPTLPVEELSATQWNHLKGALGGTTIYRSTSESRPTETTGRASVVEQLRRKIHDLDLQQERIGKQIPPGPQRIRGIAGSGKTVLLCQKAAHMHLKYPEWKIALVFHTRSLYDQIEGLVDRWINHFTNGSGERNPDKLQILHGWGAQDQPGLYGEMCQHHGFPKQYPGQFNEGSPAEKLAQACAILLENRDIEPIYDTVLIDEGQDMVVADEYKFEGKQPIYWLAYQALRPNEKNMRRLIWSYDEAQSLSSLKIPQAKELFGEDQSRLVAGTYPGGIQKSEIMKRCYRTPGPVLVAAHALGMGLKRDGDMIAGFTRQDEWGAIGYEVDGSFQAEGNQIILDRPSENSPNPTPKLWEDNLINFATYDSREEEIEALARKIRRNIDVEGLSPSRDILVIVLGKWGGSTWGRQQAVAEALQRHGIDTYIPSAEELNAQASYESNNPNRFWHEGGVTISRIHRAKGNEAEMVYVVAADRVAQYENDLYMRNQLFVALTRSKAWVELSGTGEYDLYDEIRSVVDASESEILEFEFSPPRRDLNDGPQKDLFE